MAVSSSVMRSFLVFRTPAPIGRLLLDQTICFVLFRLSHFGTDLSVAKGVGYAAGRSQAPLRRQLHNIISTLRAASLSGTLKEGCRKPVLVSYPEPRPLIFRMAVPSPDAASSGVPAAVNAGRRRGYPSGGAPTRLPWPPL